MNNYRSSFSNGYVGGYPAQQQYGYPQAQTQYQAQAHPVTNKIYVTSLEDAMARFSNPNSIMEYTLQDESMKFEITTNAVGKKEYKVFKMVESKPEEKAKSVDMSNYITIEQFNALQGKFEALEQRLANKGEMINE